MKTAEEMIAERAIRAFISEQYYRRPANDSWVHKLSHFEIGAEELERDIKEAMKHC